MKPPVHHSLVPITPAGVKTSIPRREVLDAYAKHPDLLDILQRRLENAKTDEQWADAYETLTLVRRTLEREGI